MERHVLVIFPHPDDEAFGVSGTLAMHIEKGIPVTYICLTLGEMGRNMGIPPFANRETLPQIRRLELEAAAKAIGIQDLRLFGLRDKTIEFEDEEMLVQRISVAVAELNPSLVITFYPGYAVHPDHDATGAAVVKALSRIPLEERPVLHCVAFSKGCEEEIGGPDVVADVSAFMEQKMAAMNAHKSQTTGLLSSLQRNDEQAAMMREWLSTERFWTYKWTPEKEM